MRTRPLFQFLCFILNDRHKNRTIVSHFGSRFNVVLVCELLLLLGIEPRILPQGQGILQLVVKEFGILFLDSYKFFIQSLSSLSDRFSLPVAKGYFSFKTNLPQNWGRKRRHPPELAAYINDQDSERVKIEKRKWWEEVKSQEPENNFNQDIVAYCILDVHHS